MVNDLHAVLCNALNGKSSTEIPIKKLEQLAGDDWLLEVAAQAHLLRADVKLHPTNSALAVVMARR